MVLFPVPGASGTCRLPLAMDSQLLRNGVIGDWELGPKARARVEFQQMFC